MESFLAGGKNLPFCQYRYWVKFDFMVLCLSPVLILADTNFKRITNLLFPRPSNVQHLVSEKTTFYRFITRSPPN